jgi:hypothetical protein
VLVEHRPDAPWSDATTAGLCHDRSVAHYPTLFADQEKRPVIVAIRATPFALKQWTNGIAIVVRASRQQDPLYHSVDLCQIEVYAHGSVSTF